MTAARRTALIALGAAFALPALAQGAAITGTAAYRERIALPPGAVLEVELVDISRADAPAERIAATRVEVQGQVPIAFTLPYDPARIRPERRYAVQARLTGDGMAWRNDAIVPVLTHGAGNRAEILLRRIQGARAEPGPVGPTWVAEDIAGRGVVDRLRTELTLTAEGRVHGTGGCNRFAGGYTLDGPRLRFGAMAMTNMACAPAAMDQEQRFMAALAEVQGWRVANGILHLTGAGGTTVIRLARAG